MQQECIMITGCQVYLQFCLDLLALHPLEYRCGSLTHVSRIKTMTKYWSYVNTLWKGLVPVKRSKNLNEALWHCHTSKLRLFVNFCLAQKIRCVKNLKDRHWVILTTCATGSSENWILRRSEHMLINMLLN